MAAAVQMKNFRLIVTETYYAFSHSLLLTVFSYVYQGRIPHNYIRQLPVSIFEKGAMELID